MVITIFQNKEYRIAFREHFVNLYSLEADAYPNILNKVKREDLTNVYETRIWVKIRGCDALFNGLDDGFVLLDVRPSLDVDILGAREVDRGVYHAKLPISEIQEMWEERLPFLDFPFPQNVPDKIKLEIP